MRPGTVCVAGVELEARRYVRPVLWHGVRRKMVERPGAPFNMACLVDIGDVQPRGRAPAVEDARFRRRNAKRIGVIPAPDFWKMLKGMARTSLTEIFGPELLHTRSSYSTGRSQGRASLGTLDPGGIHGPEIDLVKRNESIKPRIVLEVSDGELACRLPVTDLRLWEPDQLAPRTEVVADVARRIAAGTKVLLSVGLTRPMKNNRCWLQVNNIHLEDNPTWQVDERRSWLSRLLRR